MPDRLQRDFPLFVLGVVALPHELVPLHVFEERYKAMVERCLDEDREFGIVWEGEDGLHEHGCAVEVAEVLERLDDGRLNIVTRGTAVFRIIEEQHDAPWPSATVEFVTELEEEPDFDVLAEAHEAYGDLVEEATDKVLEPEEVAELDAYAMAATVDFGLEAKQGLLDLRSETARLRLVTRLFRAALKRLEFIERAQARARSNGKVRFG